MLLTKPDSFYAYLNQLYDIPTEVIDDFTETFKTALIKKILTAKDIINYLGNHNETLLHVAIINNHTALKEILFGVLESLFTQEERDSYLNNVTKNGFTALRFASHLGDTNTILKILHFMSDPIKDAVLTERKPAHSQCFYNFTIPGEIILPPKMISDEKAETILSLLIGKENLTLLEQVNLSLPENSRSKLIIESKIEEMNKRLSESNIEITERSKIIFNYLAFFADSARKAVEEVEASERNYLSNKDDSDRLIQPSSFLSSGDYTFDLIPLEIFSRLSDIKKMRITRCVDNINLMARQFDDSKKDEMDFIFKQLFKKLLLSLTRQDSTDTYDQNDPAVTLFLNYFDSKDAHSLRDFFKTHIGFNNIENIKTYIATVIPEKNTNDEEMLSRTPK